MQFPYLFVSQGSAEALVMWGEKIHLLIAYFLRDISVKPMRSDNAAQATDKMLSIRFLRRSVDLSLVSRLDMYATREYVDIRSESSVSTRT